ncbi:MAG TPA: DNA repair protein RecO C-terminal domain-containing protein, partial [Candidatus Paceibacterota bacterium]|nr:DNA repair protein RecO C-terminal domain-containing protein [Candidatus Paceibacterota bacterium]
HTIFAFELRLLDELGLGPDLEAAGLSAGARQILRMARQLDWSALPQLHPSPQQIAEINRFLRRFLAFHLGRVPDNREAAVQS